MTYVRSYTHVERELMHHYRDLINHAESEEDIKKFFAQTVHNLLSRITDGQATIRDGDVSLKPDASPSYEISDRLASSDAFKELEEHSDIHAVLKRFSEPAVKHCRHLRGHPEKTESKIRHYS